MSFCLTLESTEEDSAWNSYWVRETYLFADVDFEFFIVLQHEQVGLHLGNFVLDALHFLLVGVVLLPEAPQHRALDAQLFHVLARHPI